MQRTTHVKGTQSKKLQLFIADDSALVRERLVAMMGDVQGIEVVGQSADAGEAADLIRDLKPDAVTLDLHMLGGTGLDVLQRVRQDLPDFEYAPVIIMLSNYSHAPYRRKAMAEGANFFFDKSTEFEKVREVLLGMVAMESANTVTRWSGAAPVSLCIH